MNEVRKKEIFWYLYTNDSHTNKVISRELDPEATYNEVRCADGISRKLWSCDGKFITKMNRSKIDQDLKFEIFKREGEYGSIKKVDFMKKRKKPFSKKSRMTVAERFGDLGNGSDSTGP